MSWRKLRTDGARSSPRRPRKRGRCGPLWAPELAFFWMAGAGSSQTPFPMRDLRVGWTGEGPRKPRREFLRLSEQEGVSSVRCPCWRPPGCWRPSRCRAAALVATSGGNMGRVEDRFSGTLHRRESSFPQLLVQSGTLNGGSLIRQTNVPGLADFPFTLCEGAGFPLRWDDGASRFVNATRRYNTPLGWPRVRKRSRVPKTL